MIESSNIPVLAIDGGGTRCRVAVQDDTGVVAVETGSANVSTDLEGGVAEIVAGLGALSDKTGRAMADLVGLPAFVGLAGVVGPEIAIRLDDRLPLTNARIADDRPAALRGALGARDGVLAHCGTGSFYGAQVAGAMRFCGGWGPVLGDEASAQWIGRSALSAALEAVDGRADRTALAAALLDRFGGAAGIVRFAGTARPPDFGSLAPLVTEHAGAGDPLGRRVMVAGASDIARSLPLIGWTPGRTICLTGGIGPYFAAYLPEKMRADIAAPAGEPLAGALSLARDHAGETLR